MNSIVAVIPTYNRIESLKKLIAALRNQTSPLCRIVVVDNNSSDGTQEWLANIAKSDPWIRALPLSKNTGSAGGFKAGLEHGMNGRYNAFWLMDDDAFPREDALEKLIALAKQIPKGIVGSLMITPDENTLSWPITGYDGETPYVINVVDQIKNKEIEIVKVATLPYTGLLLPRRVIEKVGFPREEIFAWADDFEYCLRMKKHNYKMFVVPRSLVYHPLQKTVFLSFMKWKMKYHPFLAPWKLYYHARNTVYVNKIHFNFCYRIKYIPVFILQLIFSSIQNQNPLEAFKSFLQGLWDGYTRNMGERHMSKRKRHST